MRAMGGVHYVEQCEHGVVVAQCRCPSKDRPVNIVACPQTCPDRHQGEIKKSP